LRFDSRKSIMVDYTGVTADSNFLRINIYFQASGPFNLEWSLNKQKISIGKEDPEDTNAETKHSSHCIHSNIFDQECFLYIDYYNAKDTGAYEAVVTLKDHPNVNATMSVVVIMPSLTTKNKIFLIFFVIDQILVFLRNTRVYFSDTELLLPKLDMRAGQEDFSAV
jgi:hypothetical protein